MCRSPRFVQRVLVLALCMSVGIVVGAPTLAQAAPLGSDVNYLLRHSFSMAVGLPGAGKHEPTSCYEKNDGSHEYLCRIVARSRGDRRQEELLRPR